MRTWKCGRWLTQGLSSDHWANLEEDCSGRESLQIFLEVECVWILPSFLGLGKEILLYTETPQPTIPIVGITASLTLLGILVTGALVLCMYLMCVLFMYLSQVVVMVVHAFNPSNLESKTDEYLNSRPAWSMESIPGHPGFLEEKQVFWITESSLEPLT